jgi:hypothetical protein
VKSLPRVELADLIRFLEPPYQSRGEAQIGRVLDRYGIPFFYRQPTLIYDEGLHQIWHPDFSLPAYNGLVIEYTGMMGVPSYAPIIAHRQQTYAANTIPAVFMSPETMADPTWPEDLLGRLEKEGESLRGYGAARTAYGEPHRYH